MTREDAIDRIREHMAIHKLNEPRAVKITEALNMAIEALKEQQPRKVINRRNVADLVVGECQSCGEYINSEICPNFCGWCGDRIDWTKDGEHE